MYKIIIMFVLKNTQFNTTRRLCGAPTHETYIMNFFIPFHKNSYTYALDICSGYHNIYCPVHFDQKHTPSIIHSYIYLLIAIYPITPIIYHYTYIQIIFIYIYIYCTTYYNTYILL